MSLKAYVMKMCELCLFDNVLRVVQGDELIYEGTMEGVLDNMKYPWNSYTVIGISGFSYEENGKLVYSTMISI